MVRKARRFGEGALGMVLAVSFLAPGCTTREAAPAPATEVVASAARPADAKSSEELGPAATAAARADAPAIERGGEAQKMKNQARPASPPRAGGSEARGLDPSDPLAYDGALDVGAPPSPKGMNVPQAAAPPPPPEPGRAVAQKPLPGPAGGSPTPIARTEPLLLDEKPIDPNGRFATTYRPGGGHLAAFESAVARGLLPEAEREVIGDVGARYAPSIAKPKDRALAVQLDLERGKASPSGGPLHLRLALQSTEAKATERPRLSVHVVFDISGSMRGELIEQARAAAAALVDKLADDDELSLTTFSTGADVRIPVGAVGPRRAAIATTIASIQVEGGTNIGAGLTLGYQQAAGSKLGDDGAKVVFLLSDGRANEGITQQAALSRLALDAFQAGVQTSSFGLGTDYDGPLMSSIAQDGAGGYYYLRETSQIAPALATELGKRLDPVATAVEVRVRFKPDVEVLKVYGSRRLGEEESARVRAIEVAADEQAAKKDKIEKNRQDDREGGMRFFLPAYARDDSHAILLKLKLPPGVGSRDVAIVEVKYKDRVSKKNVTDEFPLKVTYADSDAASAASIDPSMARTVQGFGAGEALAKAAQLFARGDRNGAVHVLAEREGLLHYAATTLGEPLFVRDAQRLSRLRELAGGGSMNDPLVLAMLTETASNVHLR